MPDPATGLESFLGHATESVWKTPVAASGYNRFANQTFVSEGDETDGDVSLGIPVQIAKRIFRLRSEGDVSFAMRYQGIERWLYHLCGVGSVTTTALAGGDTGAYKHEFVLKSARHPGLSVEWHLEIFKLIMAGLKVNRCSIEMGNGVPIATFGGIGAMFANPPGSVEASPTFLEDVAGIVPLNAFEADSPGSPGTAATGFSLRVGTAGTFASPTTYCAEEPARVEIVVPLKTDSVCMGDPNILQPVPNGHFQISGSFHRQLTDDDFLTHFYNGDPVYLRMQYDGPGPIIVAGTQHYQTIIDVPYARIARAGATFQDNGPGDEEVPWIMSSPDATAANWIKITRYNKLASVT